MEKELLIMHENVILQLSRVYGLSICEIINGE